NVGSEGLVGHVTMVKVFGKLDRGAAIWGHTGAELGHLQHGLGCDKTEDDAMDGEDGSDIAWATAHEEQKRAHADDERVEEEALTRFELVVGSEEPRRQELHPEDAQEYVRQTERG